VAANSGLSFKGDYGNLLYNSGRTVNNLNVFLTLQAPMERYSAFGKAKYELTDDITAFVQGQYVSYDTKILVESGNTALSVPVTNPFIPSSLATILANRPDPANLTLQKRFHEAGPRVTDRDSGSRKSWLGLRGNLAAIDGSWEVYGSHGATVIHERQPGSVLTSSLNTLLNTADGGQHLRGRLQSVWGYHAFFGMRCLSHGFALAQHDAEAGCGRDQSSGQALHPSGWPGTLCCRARIVATHIRPGSTRSSRMPTSWGFPTPATAQDRPM
jgi:hypothetical protein